MKVREGGTTEESAPRAAHTIEEYRRGYEEEGRLRGFRSACGYRSATWGLVCPRCGRADLEETELSGRGAVAAYTVQSVPGEEFLNDAPYAYVLVDLDEGGRIAGWMPSVTAPEGLAIGTRVRFRPSYRAGVGFEIDPTGPAASAASGGAPG